MLQLPQAIPDPELLLALEPEELAAKLLFLVRNAKTASFTQPISKMNLVETRVAVSRDIRRTA